MTMVAKRKLNFDNVTDMAVKKRLRRVEQQVRNVRPEMKSNEFSKAKTTVTAGSLSYFDLSAISQGTTAHDRIGNKCKLWRVEVRGIADPSLDIYLVQSKAAANPATTDFGIGPGGFVADDKTNFVEWKYLRPKPDQVADEPIRMIQAFKTGYNLQFDGPLGGAAKNRFYFVARNNTAASLYYTISYKIWFTDA